MPPTVRRVAARAGTRSARALASNAAIRFSAALRLATSSPIRSGSCSRGVFSEDEIVLTRARSAASSWKASRPTSDSTRRLVDPTEDSLTRLITPTSDDRPTWVPAQSSRDQGPPMSTTRTTSPYFSPKRAIAPSAFASSIGSSRVTTSRLSRIAVLAISSISLRVSSERAWFHEKSRRR